jgi:iron complex transport system permease protein
VFFIGTQMLIVMDTYVGFGIQVVLMVGFSWMLFHWLFLTGERSLHLLVLVGIVFGIFFRSLSNFMQRMLDPNAFQVLQDQMFASFTRVDPALLGVSIGITALVSLVLWRMRSTFDVLTLGKATAINLGVDYRRTVIVILVAVAILVSVSTALVGPRTFFGLLVAALAHLFVGNSRHRYVLPAAVLLGIICLVGGQTLFERVFAFDTALSIIIEFLGGLVFIILVIRGAAR